MRIRVYTEPNIRLKLPYTYQFFVITGKCHIAFPLSSSRHLWVRIGLYCPAPRT